MPGFVAPLLWACDSTSRLRFMVEQNCSPKREKGKRIGSYYTLQEHAPNDPKIAHYTAPLKDSTPSKGASLETKPLLYEHLGDTKAQGIEN